MGFCFLIEISWIQTHGFLRLPKSVGGWPTMDRQRQSGTMDTQIQWWFWSWTRGSYMPINVDQKRIGSKRQTSTMTRMGSSAIKVTATFDLQRDSNSILGDSCNSSFYVAYIIWFWGSNLFGYVVFFLHVPPHTHQSHRVYPMRFARALIDLTDKMKSTALGAPELPAVVPTALEVFREWPQGNDSEEWPFAHFDVMFNYLRGSRKLKIPPEWRGTIADSLGDA